MPETEAHLEPDPVEPATGEPEAAEPEEDPVEALKAERDQLQAQLLRALADLQNFRKRAVQEREEIRKFATEALVRDLLPVLDNFERTLQAAESGASAESLLEGVKAVDRQLRSVLEGVRLARINAVGELFDPERHEAIALDVSHEHEEEDRVIDEVEPGYTMGDKVVRPARVRVSKKA